MKFLKGALPGLAAFAALGAVSQPALSHHSLAGEFDVDVVLQLRGTLTNIEWYNPHIWIYLDVVNDKGATEKWQCETGSPNQFARTGWKKENLPAGTVVRLEALRARDGSNTCTTRNITLDDGTPVFSRKL